MTEQATTPRLATPLWTAGDVAEQLQLPRTSVYLLARRGMPSIRLGKHIRFVPADIEAWIAELGPGNP